MMHRGRWLLAAILPLVSTAQAPRTLVKIFVPFNPRGLAPGLSVSAREEATCWTESLAAAARPDAWRCMAGNRIYDPCFLSAFGADAVACSLSPWKPEVVLLKLKEPVNPSGPRKQELLKALPWALELAGGRRCTLLTGATAGIAGMRINYGCSDRSSVVGDIDRSAAQWRVFVYSEEEFFLEQADVVVAWY